MMIRVDGETLEIHGTAATLTAELAYLLKGTEEYIKKDKSEVYAVSSMAVARNRAEGRKLDELQRDAKLKKEQQQAIGYK
jgi:hypothetical protein